MYCHIKLTIIVYVSDSCSKDNCEYYGECVSYPDGDNKCSHPLCEPNYSLLCGDNGINYASECWMEKEAFALKKMIEMGKNEPCCKCHNHYFIFSERHRLSRNLILKVLFKYVVDNLVLSNFELIQESSESS